MRLSDALTRDEAVERSRLLRDLAYTVRLDLRNAAETFRSETVVQFACNEPGAATFIDLDANAVTSASLNGSDLPLTAGPVARVALSDLAVHNELRIVADCAYQRTGVGLHRFTDPVDGGVYLHTQFEPFDAHRVFACFDQPDIKAVFSFSVEAPADWVVVSNAAVEEREAGHWRFAETEPLSPYVTAIVAGPYESTHTSHGDIALGLYYRRSLAEHIDADELFELTRQGFDYFERAFDYPYPFGRKAGRRKYDQLFVPEFNAGAMENAGCITFSEHYVFRSKVTDAARRSRGETLLHEMAHMWFGDLVTMRWWDDLWLNESFATFMSFAAMTSATRFTDAWADFTHDLKAWAYRQDQLPSTHPIVADMVDTDAVRTNFDGITYAKGASVLRQLVAWVGEEAFYAGLRGYFRRHEYGNATLGDFLAALEEGSGRDLGAWSAEWLETAGVATLRPEAQVAADRYSQVALLQEATAAHPRLRAHRVGIGLYDLVPEGDGDVRLRRRRHVRVDALGARTEVGELAGEAVADLLLANDDDLAYAKLRLDERSVVTLAEHLGRLDEPVARTLCWGACWDMTRDAELPARRWVQLVADHGGAETDVGVLQQLLRQASAAVDRYGDPANRTPERTRLAGRALKAATAADPGSDRQLVWVRAFASTAEDDEQLGTVRALLDDSHVIDGLAVDTELRWHLLTCLAAKGAAGRQAIAAELERDPTDMGQRRGATARTAQPLTEEKERAYDALVGDTTMPLATMRALVAGLWLPGQERILEALAPRYVDVLEPLWRDRGPEEALLLTGGMYPSSLVADSVVQIADAALALGAVPASGKRVVAEARDATLRALRARALDRPAAWPR